MTYTAAFHPWLALLAAMGVASLAKLVSMKRRPIEVAVLSAAALMAVVSLVTQRAYIGREYGFTAERAAMASALQSVPQGCGLVVPQDEKNGGSDEFLRRYRAWVPVNVPSLGSREFLEAPNHEGLPALPGADEHAPRCWYFFVGAYCYLGLEPQADGVASTCADVLHRGHVSRVRDFTIPYRSHRQVTQLDAQPQLMPLALMRIEPMNERSVPPTTLIGP
jgi:hypothetical protein